MGHPNTKLKPNHRLGALELLDLADNKISEVADGAFAELVSLQMLQLAGNRLATESFASPRPFAALASLETLRLHQNQITSFTADLFQGPVAIFTLTFARLTSFICS